MKLDEIAVPCSVVCAVKSCDILAVDNFDSAITMLTFPTIHIFVHARLDQTVSRGNKLWIVI